MSIGVLIIGDEILLGRRRDLHFSRMVEILAARGLQMSWCTIIGDQEEALVDFFRRSMSEGGLVFSFGGIGATPDDLTRASVARALGVELVRHPEAVSELEKQYGEDAYPQRIKMAELPQGSRIIPNPVNHIPGFSIGNHHFVPGFPQMSWPMVEWVLDTYYSDTFPKEAPLLKELRILEAREGSLISVMNCIVAEYPEVKLSSLPYYDDETFYVDMGLIGPPDEVRSAYKELYQMIKELGFETK